MSVAASVTVICPKAWCSITSEIVVRLADRPAGSFARTPVEVICGGCREEYRLSLDTDDSGTTISPSDHPDFMASCRPYLTDDIDWDEYAAPVDPYSVFRQARDSLGLLLSNGSWASYRTFQQMVLIQHFSIVEAYLADALIDLCGRDDLVMQRMITQVDELKSAKISLHEVLRDGEIVRNKVTSYLRGLQFHNFAKADAIYKIATKRGILPGTELDRGWLATITSLRHDCVHRNGFDKDGDYSPDIQEEIRTIDRLFANMAEGVKEAIDRLDRERGFRATE